MTVNSQVITFSINSVWKNVNQFLIFLYFPSQGVGRCSSACLHIFLTNCFSKGRLGPNFQIPANTRALRHSWKECSREGWLGITSDDTHCHRTFLVCMCYMEKLFPNGTMVALSVPLAARSGCEWPDETPVHWHPARGNHSGKGAFSNSAFLKHKGGMGKAVLRLLRSGLAEWAVKRAAGPQLHG